MLERRTVTFCKPGLVVVRADKAPAPAAGQMLVETIVSAISAGTEMLFYRGQAPRGIPVDSHLPALSEEVHYPLAYGYMAVGRITELGANVPAEWLGRVVFCFEPHTSHFLTTPETVMPVPPGISPEIACLLPNVETALNLVHDGAPLMGENVLVFGQGLVGLLTASLLSQFPLSRLVTVDRFPLRRQTSLSLGVTACLDPASLDLADSLHSLMPAGADLTYELSGAPATLNDAIAFTRFNGRVVIGSWYGEKTAPITLGGSFHRSRIRLLSSQVSTIAPELSGRWDKSRRFEVAWQALCHLVTESWITHRFPVERAAEAYQLLDQSPQDAILVLLEY